MRDKCDELDEAALQAMKTSDEDLMELVMQVDAVVASSGIENILSVDPRKMLKVLEEAEMRFGDFSKIPPPRYSTGNTSLDPFVAVLSNGLGPVFAQKLLDTHSSTTENLYNNFFSLATWLVGLSRTNISDGASRPEQMMINIIDDVHCDMLSGKVRGMAAFGKLLEERDLLAPPNPLLLRKDSFPA